MAAAFWASGRRICDTAYLTGAHLAQGGAPTFAQTRRRAGRHGRSAPPLFKTLCLATKLLPPGAAATPPRRALESARQDGGGPPGPIDKGLCIPRRSAPLSSVAEARPNWRYRLFAFSSQSGPQGRMVWQAWATEDGEGVAEVGGHQCSIADGTLVGLMPRCIAAGPVDSMSDQAVFHH